MYCIKRTNKYYFLAPVVTILLLSVIASQTNKTQFYQHLSPRDLVFSSLPDYFSHREGRECDITADSGVCFSCDIPTSNKWVSCRSSVTFFPERQILEGLRSRWLLFLGDSSTRAMVLALINQLDRQQTHPVDMVKWYNVTDPEEGRYWETIFNSKMDEYARLWRHHGGNVNRLDYIFRRGLAGVWRIHYKKASQLSTFISMDPLGIRYSENPPEVFLPSVSLGEDEVRISFYNVRSTEEIRLAWDDLPGVPDIVYANVGAWGKMECKVGTIDKLRNHEFVTAFIWGTQQSVNQSKCDVNVLSRLKNLTTVDRGVVPRTVLGERNQLRGVHYTHLVNMFDVMQVFRKLGWSQNAGKCVKFYRMCTLTGNTKTLLEKNISVRPPDQGWKTPWKFPCRFQEIMC